MKNEHTSARTADAVQFMQLRVAAKDVVQLVEYMLQHGEWYLAEERIERLRNALEGSVCPACGSDRNERDELDKAEREIERLRAEVEVLRADSERLTGERDVAIGMLAYWCVAVDQNGTGWDDWDEHYKDAMYRPCPIRELLDKEINAVRAAREWRG